MQPVGTLAAGTVMSGQFSLQLPIQFFHVLVLSIDLIDVFVVDFIVRTDDFVCQLVELFDTLPSFDIDRARSYAPEPTKKLDDNAEDKTNLYLAGIPLTDVLCLFVFPSHESN